MISSSPVKLKQPVFVVGMPRSGTTLLSSLLSSSQELVISPEIHFLTYWRSRYGFLNLEKDADFQFFLRKFIASERFTILGLPKKESSERLSALTDRSFRSIFATLLNEYRKMKDSVRVGEKTPGQFTCVPQLLDWFPDCKIIWLVRDPRAVVASLLTVPFASRFVFHKAKRWKYAQQLLQSINDDRVLPIRYEDLVVDSEATIAKLATYIEVSLRTDAATAHRPNSVGSTAFEHIPWGSDHRTKAMQPVSTSSLVKWQKTLSPLQIATIDHIAGDVARQFGYETHSHEVGVPAIRGNIRTEKWKYYAGRLLRPHRSRLLHHPTLRKWSYRLTGNTCDIRK